MGILSNTGGYLSTKVDNSGFIMSILVRTIMQLPAIPRKLPAIRDQMFFAGVRTLPVVMLVAVFMGMIVALQTGIELQRIGSSQQIATIVPISMCREMGPLITAIILAATVGSAMAAEIGTMNVSEEVMALEVMSIDPVRYLVMPRVVALAIMCPLLTIFVDIVGIIGGGMVGYLHLGIDLEFYFSQALDALRPEGQLIPLPKDLFVGLYKSFVFGIALSVIGCAAGLKAVGGALGVGQAVQQAVKNSVVIVIIFGYLITWFFYFLVT